MTSTECMRQSIIADLEEDVTKDLIEILYEIQHISYYDTDYDNTISEHLVFDCDRITRTLDSYRKQLDELNGKKDGNYPWA